MWAGEAVAAIAWCAAGLLESPAAEGQVVSAGRQLRSSDTVRHGAAHRPACSQTRGHRPAGQPTHAAAQLPLRYAQRAGIVGLGAACSFAMEQIELEIRRMTSLRNRLENGIKAELKRVIINGDLEKRLPHVTNISFEGIDDDWVISLDGIAVSSGSACTSASLDPGYVLTACGVSRSLAFSSLRYSLVVGPQRKRLNTRSMPPQIRSEASIRPSANTLASFGFIRLYSAVRKV
jgi:hypothetical protein